MQKSAVKLRSSYRSSDVCSSDLATPQCEEPDQCGQHHRQVGDRVAGAVDLGKLEAPADVPEHVADTVEHVVDQRQREAEQRAHADRRGEAGRSGCVDIATCRTCEPPPKTGSAQSRERVCLYGCSSGGAVTYTKK